MKDTVWYGELRSAKGNTIIIRDSQFPEATKGRIYLYNTERDAIIQYDEAIVTPKLFPLNNKDQKQVESQFKASWEATRKQFLRLHGKPAVTEISSKVSTSDLMPSDEDDNNDDTEDD